MNEVHPYDWAVDGAPLGTWRTLAGSADSLMNDTLTLRPDGTGLHISRSALFGTRKAALVWRQPLAGWLEIASFEEGESFDAISDDMWEAVDYVAAWQASDTTMHAPVLENRSRDGFWTLQDALHLIGGSELR